MEDGGFDDPIEPEDPTEVIFFFLSILIYFLFI
jgi:hypothetical protein